MIITKENKKYMRTGKKIEMLKYKSIEKSNAKLDLNFKKGSYKLYDVAFELIRINGKKITTLDNDYHCTVSFHPEDNAILPHEIGREKLIGERNIKLFDRYLTDLIALKIIEMKEGLEKEMGNVST